MIRVIRVIKSMNMFLKFGINFKGKCYKIITFSLKCDVLLLADVFEKFRNSCFKTYRLCRSHYLSESALIWDETLNMTTLQLELISDAAMYLFFEKSARGSVSYISKRYSKARNKYLESYDPKQVSKHSIYLYTT